MCQLVSSCLLWRIDLVVLLTLPSLEHNGNKKFHAWLLRCEAPSVVNIYRNFCWVAAPNLLDRLFVLGASVHVVGGWELIALSAVLK